MILHFSKHKYSYNVQITDILWGKAFIATMSALEKIEGCQLDTVTHIRFQSKPFFLYLRFMKETAYKLIFLIKLNGYDSLSLFLPDKLSFCALVCNDDTFFIPS